MNVTPVGLVAVTCLSVVLAVVLGGALFGFCWGADRIKARWRERRRAREAPQPAEHAEPEQAPRALAASAIALELV